MPHIVNSPSGGGGNASVPSAGMVKSDGAALQTAGAESGFAAPVVCGTNMTNANQTLQPFSDTASEYIQPATAALTAARTKTIGTTSAFAGLLVRILRKDTGAFNMTIRNGGTNAADLVPTLPPATTSYWPALTTYYNGSDWVVVGFEYVKAS
jgi:hypothetical protein